MKLPKQVCANCRAELEHKEIHWDHIPPKNLFPKGTQGIIQVPACWKCNNPDSKDDEYFRLLALHMAGENNPSAKQANEQNHRAITRPGAKGFRKALSRKTQPVAVRTESGLFAGFSVSLELDDERLKRTVSKITRGIYFYRMGQPVPEGYAVYPLTFFTLDRQRRDEFKKNQEIASMPTYGIGKQTFEFKFGHYQHDARSALFIMRVYEWAEFIALVLPEGTLHEANLTA
jgi:hypothetical protein